MRRCLVLLSMVLTLSGCADAAQWYARTAYNVECRPEKLQHGLCVPVKETPHAPTSRP
jgi:hypothetical protein